MAGGEGAAGETGAAPAVAGEEVEPAAGGVAEPVAGAWAQAASDVCKTLTSARLAMPEDARRMDRDMWC